MSNLLFVLKTRNLMQDQRVLKEIKSLKKQDVIVDVYAATDYEIDQKNINFPVTEIKIFGGAAPSNIFVRILGVLHFYVKFIFYFLITKDKYSKIWICDPIMFGLVVLIKFISPKVFVIWDHHELPPDWFSGNKFLIYLFKIAYKKSDVIIHCNNSRKDFLESRILFKHSKCFIINNVPESVEIEEENLSLDAEHWIKENLGKIVYLQNCLQEDRNGSVAIKAILGQGYKVFHAGNISESYLTENKIELNDVYLGGYLSYKQINRILNKSLFTIVLYKMNATNQIYCDPNRLYQAMNLGIPVIVGNNPSMVEILSHYKNKLILSDDGSNQDELEQSIGVFTKEKYENQRIPMSWKQFDSVFLEIGK
ncbi:glycosyl transferase family 1 [Acinetobacter sp. YH16042]|uniref:glycosyl transferase family 1 n=1 Tax=Acinetobacter sp. YH16042 TaxID=2601186 RepID=UPI0015D19DCD|nr:glycosyl transferase family 1 [Acinetobacter sp. YH16042]